MSKQDKIIDDGVEYRFIPGGICLNEECDIAYNSELCLRANCAPFERTDNKDGHFKRVRVYELH